MTSEDIKKHIGKPSLLKLKEVARGIKVGRVLGDRVLVRLIQPETKMDELEQKGLIFMPETVKDANTPRPSTGIVVQVGEGIEGQPDRPGYVGLSEGDFVMFSRYAGSDAMIDEEEFRILETREIMCTLVKKEEED